MTLNRMFPGCLLEKGACEQGLAGYWGVIHVEYGPGMGSSEGINYSQESRNLFFPGPSLKCSC